MSSIVKLGFGLLASKRKLFASFKFMVNILNPLLDLILELCVLSPPDEESFLVPHLGEFSFESVLGGKKTV